MFGLKTFLAGLFLGSVTSLLAMQFHVINTSDGLIVLPRSNRPPLRSTYVDVRKWSLAMWREHPEVAEAAMKFGRPDLLAEGALNSVFPKQTNATPAARSGSPTENAKLAMEALVPIKFTNPSRRESLTESSLAGNVPEPVLPTDQFPLADFSVKSLNDAPAVPSPSPRVHESTGQILPEYFQLDSAALRGLPKLQDPIFIFDETPAKESVQPSSEGVHRSKNGTNLFTDVLRALVPQNKAQGPTGQYSVAHPAFRVEAPQPHSRPTSNGVPQRSQPQPAVPMIRPF